MQSGPFACALVGLVIIGCSRGDRAASPGSTNDAGDVSDASVHDASLSDATEVQDAPDSVDAGGLADGDYGTPGRTCTIPAQAQSLATCQVVHPKGVLAWCHRPSEYDFACSEELDAALGCDLAYSEQGELHGQAMPRWFAYCCFCEGTDAATGCVNVDPSTYDRSCTKDSDCIAIESGMWCPGQCACCGGNAAINVDGQARYEQAIAPVVPTLNDDCNCPACAVSNPVCLRGVCTIEQQRAGNP